MKIEIENFRSLCGPLSIEVKPLTILVGENSSGKSTFLAALAHLYSANFPSFRPSFNDPPFDLGTYDSIATYKGGKFGRAKHFCIGFAYKDRKDDIRVRTTYTSSDGQPQLSKLRISNKELKLSFEAIPTGKQGKLRLLIPRVKPIEVLVDLKPPALRDSAFPIPILVEAVLSSRRSASQRKRILSGLQRVLSSIYQLHYLSPALALAPVRTKPRRTYDPVSDEFKSEGDHIPIILARMWDERDDPKNKAVIDSIRKFGHNSSLFESIDVRPLGKRPNDPFQILVNIAGPSANLLDVGYGVSQSLPIVVDSLRSPEHRLILLQQPEIHLHPRAQAALGSFLVDAVARKKKHLVVETHSDYLVDRIRYEVAQRAVRPADVQILYFEKSKIETRVWEIRVDSSGNLLGAPGSYRKFFMEEDTRILSRTRPK